MKVSRRSVLGAIAALSLTVVVGCQSPSNPSAEATGGQSNTEEKVVNLYSSRHYDSDEELYQAFTAKTGIQVNLIEGKDDELIERIKSEGQNSPADILITVDAGRLWRAEQEKLFQPISSDRLNAAIPANLRHPEGLWFGLTRRARVIVYNKQKVNPGQLSTYEALADPQWKGRICVRSSTNVYNQSLLGSMIETDGADAAERWAKALVSNFARQPEGGDIDQIKAVAAGQCDVAIVNHYYWARLAKSTNSQDQAIANQVGVFFPNQQDRGTHINISGAGVAVHAPHRDNAIAFLEYLVTPEAQEIFAHGSLEYPVVAGVNPDPIVAALGDFRADALNVTVYGKNNPEAVEIADRAGWK